MRAGLAAPCLRQERFAVAMPVARRRWYTAPVLRRRRQLPRYRRAGRRGARSP